MQFMMWNFFTKDWFLNIYRTRCHRMSKLFLCKNLWIGLFPFKALSFLNGLSYWFQIGLKWMVFWTRFWDNLSWNAHLISEMVKWPLNQLLIKISIMTSIAFMPNVSYPLCIHQNYCKLALIWDQSGICSSIRLEMRAT